MSQSGSRRGLRRRRDSPIIPQSRVAERAQRLIRRREQKDVKLQQAEDAQRAAEEEEQAMEEEDQDEDKQEEKKYDVEISSEDLATTIIGMKEYISALRETKQRNYFNVHPSQRDEKVKEECDARISEAQVILKRLEQLQ